MSEKAIENKIKTFLDEIGAYHLKQHGNMFSKAGTPDIIACVNGKYVAIEVKKQGGVVSELQKAHSRKIKKAGGISFVAYSFEEAKEYFKKYGII